MWPDIEYDLRRAICRNEISLAYSIMESGKIHIKDELPVGATVLHLAALMGYEDCVQSLLSKSMSDVMVNFTDATFNWTPLMHAIYNGYPKVAKMLLSTGKCDVNVSDKYETTALHLEASNPSNSAEVAFYLLKYGANMEARAQYSMTPFLCAIEVRILVINILQYMGVGCGLFSSMAILLCLHRLYI